MWYRKANRIADLEARLEVALRSRDKTDDDSITAELRAHLRKARTDLQATEERLGESQRRVATLVDRLGEYADRAIANGQRADRYQIAWKSARAWVVRHRAELAEQQRVIDRLTEQLFDSIGYQPAERAPLTVAPTPAISAGEVPAP